MSRGSNHSAQEVTRDTRREQEAQVGRQKASAITSIYRPPEAGAQVRILPGAPRLTCSHHSSVTTLNSRLARLVEMIRGTNSFHEPLHARSCNGVRAWQPTSRSSASSQLRGLWSRWWASSRPSIRGVDVRSSGAVLRLRSSLLRFDEILQR